MMKKTHKMLVFNMVMMMVFIIVITVQNVGVLKISALVDYSRETAVNAVSGGDNTEKTEFLVLEKFRVLLGLRALQRKTKPHNAGWENGSPAPSPSPEAAVSTPVPAPEPAVHLHKHHRPPRPKPMLPMHKIDHAQHKENGKRKVIIIAVVLSTVVVLIILALGVFFITRRFNRRKKVITRTTSNEGGNKGRSKSVTAQNLASKVIHDPSFDMFYLNSLTNALEPEVCIRGDYNCLSTSTVENIGSASQTYGRNNSENEISQSGVKDTCSLAEEVISIHEYAQSCKNESDDQSSTNGDKIIGIDYHSSEDESFHSLCDSRTSSNLRLSSVSVGSFSDPVEGFSPSQSSRSLGSPNSMPKHSTENVCNLTQQTDTNADGPDCLQTLNETPQTPPRSTPSPPPPPPPPPNFRRFSPIRTGSSSQPSVKAAKSTMILRSSSPRNSSSSQVLKETPEKGMCASSSSQHSPNSLSTIPLPPFPPPSLHNHRNSFKGPPPPPSQPPPFTPMGKDGNPLPKLKPLHWDKVRATPDRSMVWDQLRCSSFELDEETIESLFGYNLKTAFTNDEGKNKNASPSKHVLEPKRLQNITILSKAVNVTAEKVCEALVQGNGLSSQQLEALVRMAPTKEEEGKLSSYKGDIDELGSAEKLVKEMVTIPCAFERVEAMLYKATFDDEVVHLRNSFSMLEEACKELRSSRLFLKLLEAVLKTGNRMNVGTIRGGARAFKLDALLKLADVKGTDGKTTLLHFVVQEIIRAEGIRMSDSIMGQIDRISKRRTAEEKEEDYKRMGLDLITGLSTELCNVKRTASLDLDVLATSVSNLSDGMSKLKQLVNKDLSTTKDNFVHAMKSFMSHAESNLQELQAEENKVLQSVRQITEYYHGDVSKEEINPLRIFVVVRDFLGMLDQVCRELKTLKTPRSPNPLAPFQ